MEEIIDDIAQDRPIAAQKVVERIQRSIAYLTDHPLLGRQGRVPGTRELVVPGTPFILPYRVKDEIIEILHVLHAARRWPSSF